MNDFFARLSKTSLALLVVGGGIIFIIFLDPPHTVCKSQVEQFKQSQQGFLYLKKLKKRNKLKKTTAYVTLHEYCKGANSPGGCSEFFIQMKKMLNSAEAVNTECRVEVGNIKEVKQALADVLKFMIRSPWGDKAPTSYYERKGWFSSADIALYCHLKRLSAEYYGKAYWGQFIESSFKTLPEAKAMTREKVWELTLFPINCREFR